MTNPIYKINAINSEVLKNLKDNGGRRIGVDRRCFSYSLYIPERRSHDDRRKENNRRKQNRIK
jgi:hypothetical protein